MAPFNPYRQWLGIPPEEQPAHHYRLLGITDFESDRGVAGFPYHVTYGFRLVREVD